MVSAVRRLGTSPIGGNPAGDVVIVDFNDYQCPYCKRTHPAMKSVVAADGKVIDHGVVGEFGLLLLFLDAKQPLSQAVAARAAAGWGGDRYVAWDNGDQTCLRANFVMDTQADTDQLASALREWAGHQPGATVQGSNPIILTTCG